jgi:NTE family protein
MNSPRSHVNVPVAFHFPMGKKSSKSKHTDKERSLKETAKESMRDILSVSKTQTYDAIVLSSGGVRGISHLGALDVLWTQYPEVVRNTRYFVGSSAGAVVATLLAIGITPRDALDGYVIPFRYKKDIRLHMLSTLFGIEAGNSLESFLETIIDRQTTFKDILDLHGTVLSILGTNLNASTTHIFDAIRTPNTPVFDALRVSCSVPLIFPAVRINGEYFVDGAIANPFPVNVAMDTYGCQHILGLRFDTFSATLDKNTPWKLDTYLGAVIDTMIHAASMHIPARRGVVTDIVTVTTPNDISGIHFDIPPEKKYELFDSGAESMISYIKKHL